jgi:hypothetical protein
VKINDNTYSGFLFCGDCGSPMFAMSRRDLKDAYRCGDLPPARAQGLHQPPHPRGQAGRGGEGIRPQGAGKLRRHAGALNADLAKEDEDVGETEQAAENLTAVLADLQEELKATKRQRIRDIMKHPEQRGDAGGDL